jgi:ribosomal protein S18 acetylase RimI-like enzyme
MSPEFIPALKEGFLFRPATLEDIPAISDLLNLYWEPLVGMRKFTPADLTTQFNLPGFSLPDSVRLIQSPSGQLVAVIQVFDVDNPPVHPNAGGCVHPDFEHQGLGSALLEWAQGRARQAIARVPDGLRVTLVMSAEPTHQPTVRLFEKHGLHPERYFFLMIKDLAEPFPQPVWSEGMVLRTYHENPDLRGYYRATIEAFMDHWGIVQGNEDERIARWQYRLEHDKEVDPSLWFMVMDGEQIAATARCAPTTGADQNMGFVETLGVRRPWRRQGLALNLLYQIFAEFARRNKQRVGLGVDSSSLTGATRLYEKAGMLVASRIAQYEKILRAGEELGTQSIAE